MADAAKVLDLEPYLDRKPKALSGGQRQRVAMGRAMVREPRVFCMDEPLSNLDVKLRVQTRAQIAALQRRLGTTTVYVTHDQVEAMTMGDRVAVLKDGVLQQCDTPTALYERPVNVFVAGFIGSPAMNIRECRIADDAALIGDAHVPLPRATVAALAAEGADTVLLGFRSESWSRVPQRHRRAAAPGALQSYPAASPPTPQRTISHYRTSPVSADPGSPRQASSERATGAASPTSHTTPPRSLTPALAA